MESNSILHFLSENVGVEGVLSHYSSPLIADIVCLDNFREAASRGDVAGGSEALRHSFRAVSTFGVHSALIPLSFSSWSPRLVSSPTAFVKVPRGNGLICSDGKTFVLFVKCSRF